MDFKTFLENFDAIAEAPGGIQNLRELILDLAVRGMLVPQNPEDEPASRLLARIQVNINKISRKKNSIQNISELPFDLPETWESVCLDQITSEVHYGLTASANFTNNEIKLLRITDIQNNSVNWSSVPGCDIELEKAKKYRLTNGDIVIARTGGTVGKSYLVESLQKEDFAVFASYLIRAVPSQHINYKYLKLVLESPIYWVQLSSSTTGTGQPNVNATSLKGFVLPLPPLAEQKRIVEKVDELMALCDRYEAAKQTRDNLRQQLRGSAINSLMNAETDEELKKGWAIVRDNWHSVSQHSQDVNDLRQAVLQLAVRGKLVPQNPEDEPASVLLDKIKFQKEQLIKEKKIRKLDSISAIDLEEMLYELPNGWEWVRFGDTTICRDWERIPLSRDERAKREGEFDYYGASGAIDKIDGYLFDRPLLLIGEDGANLINRSTPIAFMADGKYWVNNHAHVLDSFSIDCLRYLEVLINAIDLKPYVTGTAQPKMNQAKMNSIPVPLPPLAEQKRIVAKVDELMQLCDQLEASLRQSQQRAESLAASAISHLTI